MISTATTSTAPARTQPPPPPPPGPPPLPCTGDVAAVDIPSLYVAQLLLGKHQAHTTTGQRPCSVWMAATAYLSADCGEYE